MGTTAQREWSKAYLFVPVDNHVSHIFLKKKKFKASFENDDCPPSMNLLLGWEYARIWLKERNEFNEKFYNINKKGRNITQKYKQQLKEKYGKKREEKKSTENAANPSQPSLPATVPAKKVKRAKPKPKN